MNKDTEISVKTPVGPSKSTVVSEGLGQGTNESAIISAANLSGGVTEQFANSNTEVSYTDRLMLGPWMYIDDVARLDESLEAAQDGNDRMQEMAERKLLDFSAPEPLSGLFWTTFFAPPPFSAKQLQYPTT